MTTAVPAGPVEPATPVADRPGGALTALCALVAAARPRQWVKNLLVIGAPMASGRLLELPVARATAVACVSLCLASSATYLLNDLHDLAEDRSHPVKRHRPLAAGRLAPGAAVAAMVVVALAAVALASLDGLRLAGLVVVYLALTTAYTLRLRREPIMDLVVVAAGFILRGAAGGVGAAIPMTSWFLLVAGFGSLFLVSGKRYAELLRHEQRSEPGGELGGELGGVRRETLALYSVGYLRFVWASAATLTIITYALWANTVFLVRGGGSWALWSLLPFVIALLRYAYDLERGRGEAPEELLLGDRVMLGVGLVWVIMFALGAGGFNPGV